MLSLGLLRSTATKLAPTAQKLSVPAVCNQTRNFVKYNWVDPLNLESQLTDEEKLVRLVIKRFCMR
jgi:glutaryl-CoA dehydrogenase